MNTRLMGSNLTQAMLKVGYKRVWCAVSNESDSHAMAIVSDFDLHLLVNIVSVSDDGFLCKKGKLWQYAVPVKRVELTHDEVGL